MQSYQAHKLAALHNWHALHLSAGLLHPLHKVQLNRQSGQQWAGQSEGRGRAAKHSARLISSLPASHQLLSCLGNNIAAADASGPASPDPSPAVQTWCLHPVVDPPYGSHAGPGGTSKLCQLSFEARALVQHVRGNRTAAPSRCSDRRRSPSVNVPRSWRPGPQTSTQPQRFALSCSRMSNTLAAGAT